jgi:hypothetical protein
MNSCLFKKNKVISDPGKKCSQNELTEHVASYKKLEIFQTQFGTTMLEFLLNECPDLCLLDHIIDHNFNQISYKTKKMIVSGSIQSGKSIFIMAFALLNVLFGKSSIILFRNITADLIQFEDRIRRLIVKFQKSRKIIANVSISTSTVIKKSNPTIYLCIANEASMRKINGADFVLIIDEVDFVDSKSEVRSVSLDTLKDAASFVLGVTATPLATCVEWNLPANGIVELSRKSNYVGFDNQEDLIQFHEIDTGSKTIPASVDDIEKIYENTPALAEYLQDFSKCPLAPSNEGSFMQEMTLIRLCTGIVPQTVLAQEIIAKYPEMGVVVFVKRGSYIYHPSFGTVPISVDKERSKVSGNIHEFSPDVDVGAVLALFQGKGVGVIPRVVCIAGVRAARGISFSSGVVPEDASLRLRANSMFVKISTTTVNSEILQIFGRVLGNFEGVTDKHPQRIYCSAADCESVQKAFLTLQELLNRTCRKYGEVVQKFVVFGNGRGTIVNTWQALRVDDAIPNMRTLLEDIEMSDFKCVVYAKMDNGKKKKIIRKITSRKAVMPQLVKDDGEGDSEESYILDLPVKSSIVVEGDCLLIDPSTLGQTSLQYYTKIVEYFNKEKSTYHSVVTLSKADLIKNVFGDGMKTTVINSSWAWHSPGSKNHVKATRTEKGLLFFMNNNTWFVRYNF